jgi:hypothetical protein
MILHLVDNAPSAPQHVVDSARYFGYSAITVIEARAALRSVRTSEAGGK